MILWIGKLPKVD